MSYFLSFPTLTDCQFLYLLPPNKTLEMISLSVSIVPAPAYVIILPCLHTIVITPQLITLLFISTSWLEKIFLKYKLGFVNQFFFFPLALQVLYSEQEKIIFLSMDVKVFCDLT